MATTNEPSAAAPSLCHTRILTNILEYVKEPFQLFVFQSVNSTFQDVIRGTKSIRQRLYLGTTDNCDSISQLLYHPKIRAATHTFSINSADRNADCEHYDFELGCQWIWRQKCEGLEQPLLEDLACLRKGIVEISGSARLEPRRASRSRARMTIGCFGMSCALGRAWVRRWIGWSRRCAGDGTRLDVGMD